MKHLFFLVVFSLSSISFGAGSSCEALKQVLVSTQTHLKFDSITLKLADSSRTREASTQKLDLSIQLAERALNLTRTQGCVSFEKIQDGALQEKFSKLTELAIELDGSNNQLIKRSIRLDGEISYLLATLK